MFYPERKGGAARNTFVTTPDKMSIPFNYNKKNINNSKKQVNELPIRDLRAFLFEMIKQGAQEKDVRKLFFDLHSKLAIPFASFAFAMIAAPLALRPQRASSSIGLGISLIFILVYYILQQLFRALGMQYMNPVVAAWFPDALLFLIGGWLCIKARK